MRTDTVTQDVILPDELDAAYRLYAAQIEDMESLERFVGTCETYGRYNHTKPVLSVRQCQECLVYVSKCYCIPK